MTVIQTYQQGARHKAGNLPCEDRTYALSENGVDAIALADGAGSAKYTHAASGAECVTQTVCTFFCNNFDKFYEKKDNAELSAVVMAVCQRALQKKAEELELDGISRLSSTMLCVAIKGDRVIACHIGDGVIGKLTADGVKVVSGPENGEFAGTTFFMTNPHADRYIHIIKELREDAVAYFLMSDGTADYVYNKTENTFYEAAAKMARMAQEENGQYLLEETVRNYMVERDRQSDDCSFICLSAAAQSETKTQCAAVQPEDGVRQSAEQVPSDKETQDSAEACGKENKRHTVTHLVENFDRPDSRRINAGDVAKGKQVKNKKRLLFAVACFVLILALVISLSGRKSGKKHTQPTSRPTTTAVSEKHSEESDLTDDTAGDALTETEESSAATSSLSQNSSETSSGEERMDEENEVSASSRSEEETESSKAAKEPELTDRPGN